MWQDLLSQHEKSPMHLMVGGESWQRVTSPSPMCINCAPWSPAHRQHAPAVLSSSESSKLFFIPLTLLSKGGDQLYNDSVFSGPILGSFDEIETDLEATEKMALPFSPRMKV